MRTALLLALLLGGPALAQEAEPVQVMLTGREPGLGLEGVRYTVVQFSDWRCPHCARAWETLESLVRSRSDVRLVFKVYPLTGRCNPAVTIDQGDDRCVLAAGAVCADRQGRFLDYAAWVFAHQGELDGVTDRDLAERATTIGLDGGALGRCLASGEVAGPIQADAVEGMRLGLVGTPSLFLHDRHGGWEQISGGAAAVAERIAGGR